MTRLVLGPFNRVEGDLEVTLEVEGGAVRSARVNAPMFRGFECILAGKDPLDALVIVPRICGICSVSQSSACAQALAAAMGIEPPANGRLAAKLTLAAENLADHFAHFYLFFMPDFARECYRDRPWFARAEARFKAVTGSAAAEALPARMEFLRLMGFLAGKWPHTLSIQPGGSSRPVQAAECIRLFAVLRQFRGFLERRLFGAALEEVAALESAQALAAWAEAAAAKASDFGMFLEIARDLELHRLGRATDRFISYGAYPGADGKLFRAGVWDGSLHELDPAAIREDISHAWLSGPEPVSHPSAGVTVADADKAGGYTWCKAPRWNGRVMEAGAIARQMVNGHPLVRDLVAGSGGNVANRVIARLLELALVLPEMERWVRELRPGEPFCNHGVMPREAAAAGMVESARGALGHWLEIAGGRIRNYQIVAPTTWNFSPRDRNGTPGALEQALAGTPVAAGEAAPVAVQHVVRSFDPCMVCTVH
ncbi:MAG: nickel-dependent hydrogenase large subunit [Rhodocyclaceae bacterium]